MITILSQSPVCDGYDVAVQMSDNTTRTVHFTAKPTDVPGTVDAIVAQWEATLSAEQLAALQAAAAATIVQQTVDLVNGQYPVFQQQAFQALMTGAMLASPPYANRIAYIGQMLAWVQAVMTASFAAQAAIAAATTSEAIAAVVFDPTQFLASEPHVSLPVALGMTN